MSNQAIMAIVNPASAAGRTERLWLDIRQRLYDRDIDCEVHRTTGPQEATSATRSALRSGFSRILAVGGDGTLNEVVNGCFDEATGELIQTDVCLGMVPSGSGGDFSRTIGIRDVDTAVDVIVQGRTRPVDVCRIEYLRAGELGRHFFLNIADWGVGAAVVTRVNNSSQKGGGARGTAVFLGISLSELLRFSSRRVTLTLDGRTLHREVTNLVVANGQYFGGGMRIAPFARIDDGLLDVILVPKLPAWRTLWSVPRLYRGTHLHIDGVEMHRTREIRIEPAAGADLDFEAEGEPLGTGGATVTCLAGAIGFMV